MELRGHEHVVECAVFAPIVAYPAIRELAALGVSFAQPITVRTADASGRGSEITRRVCCYRVEG
jgi:hypothetical protein